MTHSYKITGMTCGACQSKVETLLSKIEGVTHAIADLHTGEVKITMQKHISASKLQDALKGTKYQLTEIQEKNPPFMDQEEKSWFATYKPVLILFLFITGICFFVQVQADSFSWMMLMRNFMAGFFLAFSFFKILNLQGFADSYAMYDVIAKRWRAYGFIYAFIELGLGIAFLTDFYPLATNITTFIVMGVSLVGVLQSVLNKRKIRCACLGDVFNLPMSTLTIIEDALMMLMSLITIIHLIV